MRKYRNISPRVLQAFQSLKRKCQEVLKKPKEQREELHEDIQVLEALLPSRLKRKQGPIQATRNAMDQ
jgi:hypothetical protein